MATDRLEACAVVVGAADSPYLPHTLSALAAQTHPPQQVLLALLSNDEDTPDGGGADPQEILTEAGLGSDRAVGVAPAGVQVVPVAAAASFGEAVQAALAAAAPTDADDRPPEATWLWLLHDDSAPDAGALAALLATVDRGTSVAVAGVKQVDWDDPDELVSVGVSLTVDGQRYTGIEDGEIDQGQHDGREDVYAVGTAGMLIRVQMWQRLGGPDPALGSFGDGADLCRRARLAGGRVIVVPAARVRHARAGWHGLRTRSGARSRQALAPDPRRSFRAARAAQLHSWLVRAPALLVPLVALAVVALAPLRALWRVASNELTQAADELRAAAIALLRPRAIVRARRRAARTRKVSARRLAPLQATWGQLWRARRNRRLQAVAEQRAAAAPSELEMAERATVARRRRLTFGAVLIGTTLVALVTLGRLLVAGPLIGGALLPVDVSFTELWQGALSAWLPTGDGYPGPPDPLWAVLGVLSAITGGWWGAPVYLSVTLVLVLAMPVAAINAWFAAGAASRSVLVRAWAAGVWAFGPPLLLALGDGRLGAVLAHLALPLMALGTARALGLDRRDEVVSGMVGARRLGRRTASTAPRSAREAKRARLAALAAVGTDESEDIFADLEPIRSNTATERQVGAGAESDEVGGEEEQQERATVISRVSRAPSMAAAAGAGLAFAVAAAGAPVLLPAGLVALLALGLMLGRRRHLAAGRARLIVVALPAIVLLGPVWTEAIRTASHGGWRLLLADPGVPLASDTGPAWLTLLTWPAHPPTGPGPVLASGIEVLPLVATAALVIGALLALLRGGGRGRVVRLAWLLTALGLGTALISSRTVVGVGRARDSVEGVDELVTGWAGPGTSLVLLGLLLATVSALDGLQGALAGRAFGWRQVSAVLATVLLVAGLGVSGGTWVTTVLDQRASADDSTDSNDSTDSTDAAGRPGEPGALRVQGRGASPVPALGRTLQAPEQGARVLALTGTAGGVDAQLWRHNGPQLTESATVTALGLAKPYLDGPEAPIEPDAADADLMALVADLSAGSAVDAAGQLADHAVAVVIVPPVDSAIAGPPQPGEAARSRLIAHLDAVPALERVTENPAGVIWRVSSTGDSADGVIARAQVRDDQGQVHATLTFGDTGTARLGPEGTGRTLVLAERSATAWRAELDGRSLRATGESWQQQFTIPDGATGELTVHYRPVLHTPWQVFTVVILGLTVLLALPTRRRREGA